MYTRSAFPTSAGPARRTPGPFAPARGAAHVETVCGVRKRVGWPRIEPMRVVSIGAGPAGLYFSLLMKKADPAHDITVVERNRADDTFGFGVVFSDATLENVADADRESHAEITGNFAHWEDIDIHYRG